MANRVPESLNLALEVAFLVSEIQSLTKKWQIALKKTEVLD
jgi:hypothetical protein